MRITEGSKRITGRFGSLYDEVRIDGVQLDLALSLRVVNHSPTGFAWGYGGSGPAQLALAILLHAGIEEDDAVRLHQEFKRDFLEQLPADDFELVVDVADWAERAGP